MRNPFRRKTEEEKLYDDYSREYDVDTSVFENNRNLGKKAVDEYNNASSFDEKKRIYENFFYFGNAYLGDLYTEEELDRQFQKQMQKFADDQNDFEKSAKIHLAKRFGDRAKRKFK
tara:strand:+ start:4180 stop:4527 length:348 start_codon:yes stop_codon:yes gene_type:complete